MGYAGYFLIVDKEGKDDAQLFHLILRTQDGAGRSPRSALALIVAETLGDGPACSSAASSASR